MSESGCGGNPDQMNNYKINYGALIFPGLVWLSGILLIIVFAPRTVYVNGMVGLGFLARNWLTDLKVVWPTVMAVDTWKGMGYIMVVVIAGLLSISPEYYEAAGMDGANFRQKLFYITLPLLKPILLNVTVLNVTYGLRVFDMIYSLTNGGPGTATNVINTAVFKEFSKGDLAMGTTLSSILFFIMLFLLYFIIKAMENKEVDA